MKKAILNISAKKRTRFTAFFVAGIVGLVAIGGDLTWTAFADPGVDEEQTVSSEPSVDLDSLYTAKTSEHISPDTTYVAALDPQKTIEGHVSWYGPKFHGRRTANGERFDMRRMTAAHKTLPFNTLVRVEDRRTGKAVLVRINDRGPYVRGRILDLSRQAAERLGMKGRGYTDGEIHIYPETVLPAATTMPASQKSGKKSAQTRFITFDSDVRGVHPDGWSVQIGTFDIYDEAIDLHNHLADSYDDVFLTCIVKGKSRQYVVSVGLVGNETLGRDLLIELGEQYTGATVIRFRDGFPHEEPATIAATVEETAVQQ